MAGFFSKLRGTFSSVFQIGKTGPNLKDNAGVLESRNNADSDYVQHRLADPAGHRDGVSRQYYFVEHANPQDAFSYAYENLSLYDASGSPQAANEAHYTRLWLPAGRTLTTMRTHIQSGANGTRQLELGIYDQADPESLLDPAATTIAVASNGVVLPAATINVASTAGFPTSGTVFVTTASGVQVVAYTGVTATSFTGCTGGVGAMATGGAVSTLRRVATTGADVPPNATTGRYDVALTGPYAVPVSGYYWVAIHADNGTMAFLISSVFRANSIKRREETLGAFGLPALAGTLTSPQSAVIYAAAVE